MGDTGDVGKIAGEHHWGIAALPFITYITYITAI
jgi:hypothetical protein